MGHGHPSAVDPMERLLLDKRRDQQQQRLKFSIEETGKDLTINLTKNKLFD